MRGKPEDQALITGKWFLPLRGDNTSKADFGCLLAVCGSAGMSGAACMAVSSALRCGAGLVALASAERVIERAAQSLWEPIFLPLADDGKGFIAQEAAGLLRGYRRATALLLGCGMGKRPETAALALEMLRKTELPLVIDADGLTSFGRDFPDVSHRKGETVVTPHRGEMACLTGEAYEKISESPMWHALNFAKSRGAVTVLKGSVTAVASPDGRSFLLNMPNSGLSKGGSGDVLAGCIGSFLAQGVKGYEAALLGVCVHAEAGKLARLEKGVYGMLPRDIIENIPYAIKNMEEAPHEN